MKKLILLIALVCVAGMSSAQRYNLGVGLRAGATNFLGDIGNGDAARGFVFNMNMADTRWMVGPFVRYRFHPLFAVQGSFNYFRLEGEDADSENRARLARNLNFRNDAFDFSAKLEYYPQVLAVNDVGYRGVYRLDYQTYFLVGAGGIINTPRVKVSGTKGKYTKVRKGQTEGVKYSPVAFNIPMGGGLFFTYKRYHRIGFEFTWNWTFTDYLDDISNVYVDPSAMADPSLAPLANQYKNYGDSPGPEQYGPGSPRGDATDRDNYMLMSFSYSYLFRTRNSFYRRNYSWMYGRKKKWGGTKAKF